MRNVFADRKYSQGLEKYEKAGPFEGDARWTFGEKINWMRQRVICTCTVFSISVLIELTSYRYSVVEQVVDRIEVNHFN